MTEVKGHDAVSLLMEQVKDNPEFDQYYQEACINTAVAQMIYDARQEAGLTQAELAKQAGIAPDVISDLENADYEGNTLPVLTRIATALHRKIRIELEPIEHKAEE